MVNKKLKIAVSSCLLGEAVRYDGTDKHIEYITQTLATEYTLISLCPEMAVGMGVPRAPIHLVDNGNTIQVRGIDNPDNDMTSPLIEYAGKVFESYPDICGYIFKKNSPSCGTKNVKVFNATTGQYERRGQGIYSASIEKCFNSLPVIDEEELFIKAKAEQFFGEVAYYAEKIKLAGNN